MGGRGGELLKSSGGRGCSGFHAPWRSDARAPWDRLRGAGRAGGVWGGRKSRARGRVLLVGVCGRPRGPGHTPTSQKGTPEQCSPSSGASEVPGKEGTRLKWGAHSLQTHSSHLETRVKPLQVSLCALHQAPLSHFPGTQPGRDPRSPPSRMLGPALRLEADRLQQGGSFVGKGRPDRRPALGSATGAFYLERVLMMFSTQPALCYSPEKWSLVLHRGGGGWCCCPSRNCFHGTNSLRSTPVPQSAWRPGAAFCSQHANFQVLNPFRLWERADLRGAVSVSVSRVETTPSAGSRMPFSLVVFDAPDSVRLGLYHE